jgi:uncharacterized protein YgiB involved in biofilm formation
MTQSKANAQPMEQQLDQLIDQAHDACKTSGDVSSECAAAWDAVEEVQAAMSDKRDRQKTKFQNYCDENPDASECRIYDV